MTNQNASAISALPTAIMQWLSEQEHLEGIHFLTEFPAQNKAVPLRRAIVAVGMSSVNITDKFEENDDGVLERQEYCRSASLRIRLDIHVPFADGGDRCHEIFTKVLDVMTFASDLYIRASGCRDIRAQRDTDAFVLEAWADIHATFCPADSTGLSLKSFLYKDLLCGSHIGDRSIHLEERDRTWLDEPYRWGNYVGDGVANRVINIGFRPQAVFVTGVAHAPVEPPRPGITNNMAWMGMAWGDFGSMGVELTASGFRVRAGAGMAMGGVQPATNQNGWMYTYFVLV